MVRGDGDPSNGLGKRYHLHVGGQRKAFAAHVLEESLELGEGAELIGGRKEPETTALGAIGIQDRPRIIHETIAGIAVTWHFLWFTTSHI